MRYVSLQSCSAIGVETRVTWPGTVTKLRMVCIYQLFKNQVHVAPSTVITEQI